MLKTKNHSIFTSNLPEDTFYYTHTHTHKYIEKNVLIQFFKIIFIDQKRFSQDLVEKVPQSRQRRLREYFFCYGRRNGN